MRLQAVCGAGVVHAWARHLWGGGRRSGRRQHAAGRRPRDRWRPDRHGGTIMTLRYCTGRGCLVRSSPLFGTVLRLSNPQLNLLCRSHMGSGGCLASESVQDCQGNSDAPGHAEDAATMMRRNVRGHRWHLTWRQRGTASCCENCKLTSPMSWALAGAGCAVQYHAMTARTCRAANSGHEELCKLFYCTSACIEQMTTAVSSSEVSSSDSRPPIL